MLPTTPANSVARVEGRCWNQSASSMLCAFASDGSLISISEAARSAGANAWFASPLVRRKTSSTGASGASGR